MEKLDDGVTSLLRLLQTSVLKSQEAAQASSNFRKLLLLESKLQHLRSQSTKYIGFQATVRFGQFSSQTSPELGRIALQKSPPAYQTFCLQASQAQNYLTDNMHLEHLNPRRLHFRIPKSQIPIPHPPLDEGHHGFADITVSRFMSVSKHPEGLFAVGKCETDSLKNYGILFDNQLNKGLRPIPMGAQEEFLNYIAVGSLEFKFCLNGSIRFENYKANIDTVNLSQSFSRYFYRNLLNTNRNALVTADQQWLVILGYQGYGDPGIKGYFACCCSISALANAKHKDQVLETNTWYRVPGFNQLEQIWEHSGFLFGIDQKGQLFKYNLSEAVKELPNGPSPVPKSLLVLDPGYLQQSTPVLQPFEEPMSFSKQGKYFTSVVADETYVVVAADVPNQAEHCFRLISARTLEQMQEISPIRPGEVGGHNHVHSMRIFRLSDHRLVVCLLRTSVIRVLSIKHKSLRLLADKTVRVDARGLLGFEVLGPTGGAGILGNKAPRGRDRVVRCCAFGEGGFLRRVDLCLAEKYSQTVGDEDNQAGEESSATELDFPVTRYDPSGKILKKS